MGPVPERCNNSIPGINMPYSSTFIPGIELLHLSGTGPWWIRNFILLPFFDNCVENTTF